MAQRIPDQFIDQLLSRTDIVAVIDGYVPLKQTGSNYVARCPFHEERTPSFSVSPTKQFYHCFGCGAHGSAIGFLMQHEHMSFLEAVEELANRAGLQLPDQEASATEKREGEIANQRLYAIMEMAAEFYRLQLRQHAASQSAISYLKQRGLSGEIAARYGVGYAPPGWDNLLKALQGKQVSETELLAGGLIIARSGKDGYYDRFRERIMFPIRDQRERVIAFGGRVLDDSTPKYLNSPETAIFHKGSELYGLFEARRADRQLQRLIVVEGYMDVIALAQFGINNAAATLGTAATATHMERLFKIVPEVIFCFDGDRAGHEAAWRALQHALPAMKDGRQARFLFLPDGDDPDSFVRRDGADAFRAQAEKALPLSTYLFQSLEEQTDTSHMDGRARLVELARPLLSNLHEGIYKQMLQDELATRAGVRTDSIARVLRNDPTPKDEPSEPRPGAKNPNRLKGQTGQSLVRRALSLLVHEPELARDIPNLDGLRQVTAPGVNLLVELIEFIQAKPHMNTGMLVELWRDREEARIIDKLIDYQQITPKDGSRQEFLDGIQRIQMLALEERADILLRKPWENLTAEEKRELAQVIQAGKTAARTTT